MKVGFAPKTYKELVLSGKYGKPDELMDKYVGQRFYNENNGISAEDMDSLEDVINPNKVALASILRVVNNLQVLANDLRQKIASLPMK